MSGAPGSWVLPGWTGYAPKGVDLVKKPKPAPTPVSLVKRVKQPPRAEVIYSPNFRPPPVPLFPVLERRAAA